LKAILGQGPEVQFWRVIKFAIRYHDEGWTINPQLVNDHKGLYDRWIGSASFMEKEENQKDLIQQNFTYGLAKTVEEYGNMVGALEVMGFEEELKKGLGRNDIFKERWITALKQQDQNIIDLFIAKGYPSDQVM